MRAPGPGATWGCDAGRFCHTACADQGGMVAVRRGQRRQQQHRARLAHARAARVHLLDRACVTDVVQRVPGEHHQVGALPRRDRPQLGAPLQCRGGVAGGARITSAGGIEASASSAISSCRLHPGTIHGVGVSVPAVRDPAVNSRCVQRSSFGQAACAFLYWAAVQSAVTCPSATPGDRWSVRGRCPAPWARHRRRTSSTWR